MTDEVPDAGGAGSGGTGTDDTGASDPITTDTVKGLAGVVGQELAVRTLRAAAAKPVHAYLFVGPPGSGKLAAAREFAAMLLCPNGGEDGCDTCRRVREGAHPDVIFFEREGAALSIDQARDVSRIAVRSSLEGGRQVIVLPDLHLAREAVPALLKTIEEPPPHTVFIALADFVPPDLVTIASRCVRVEFRPLTDQEIVGSLVADGVPPERASLVAGLAAGRLDRARLLASDEEAESRRRAWETLPARFDGSGATVALLAEELVDALKRSAKPLMLRQEAEVAELVEVNAVAGQTGPGRAAQTKGVARELEERHRREQRRQRTDELRTGLAALAGAYRDRVVSGALPIEHVADAVALIDGLSADLAFNPGELLALQALLLRLDRLG
ncbi:MAG TPA: ATP-binding protein [Acidimicrobiales bacterium]|nr:ATP-binding protein [Acidimicrobiales bacterium]